MKAYLCLLGQFTKIKRYKGYNMTTVNGMRNNKHFLKGYKETRSIQRMNKTVMQVLLHGTN